MNKRVRKIIQTIMFILLVTLVFNFKTMAASYDTYFDSAQALALDNQIIGQLSSTNLNQGYVFSTTSNKSYYKITGINSSCTDMITFQLYNADKSEYGSNKYIVVSTNKKNEMILELPKNTTFYLIVKPYSSYSTAYGNFAVSVAEIRDDCADEYTQSTTILLDQTKDGCIEVSGNLSDTDFYKFTTPEDKNCYYNISVSNTDIDGYVQPILYDNNLVQSEYYTYVWKNEQRVITKKLVPNQTYYLKMSSDSVGNYKINIAKLPDDVEDNYDKATEVNLNQLQKYSLQAKDDIDYFCFNTNGIATEYTIQTTMSASAGSVSYEIFDKNQLRVGYSHSFYSSGNNEKFTLKKNSTYYIKVTGTATAEYTFKVNCKAETKYKISYKLNGGINNSNNPSTYTKTQTVKLQNPTKTGSIFKGWYTDKSCKNSIKKISKGSTKNYTLYAKWEKIKLAKASVSSLKNSGKSKIKIAVDKVNKAKGYEINIASDKNMTNDKVVYNMKKTSMNISGLVKGNTYYVQVRAYSQDSMGNTVYGKYSAVKKVKITK